mmetsp:Transcript_9838/g.9506  ORF Transcript_9838/g.9506 Transcript_9838/m.9506 type:complete len:203 (-) Transcript_9838:181-789(-)|eukprot:CAMPEP_0197828300 /NCGR_PEP_ID=MMETSP1437-20131217/4896_1 /TAXON_ID=49252 ORGANISM="Eucampia antarctica, Strain CCMP1452" /NCGR_SAMPLE_ID=MMETSP1437 /ASSEMBLY_ACC=CAM_ASM_001096 /LENGTH=202 /DNA_ID=CAMNT_0043429469 /DNA_START=104 /DNA_END=712 /DNA_ORIENTATION=+
MLSRISSTVVRQCANTLKTTNVASSSNLLKKKNLFHQQCRTLATPAGPVSANDLWKRSCYFEMDFTINEESMVDEVVNRFSAYDIGCLVTVDSSENITGVISERDLIHKVALLGNNPKETQVKEIATTSANLVTASIHDEVDECMEKLLTANIRHLPLLDESGHVIGMLSIKDLCRAVVAEQEVAIQMLSDFAAGKGGHFTD